MSDTVEKRKLCELRVVDLKQELEKRGKDGNGVKNVLIERLTQALKEEKKNPETFEFEIGSVGKTPAKKKPPTGNSKTEEESAGEEAGAGKENNVETIVLDCDDDDTVEAKADPTDEAKQQPDSANAPKGADKTAKDDTKEADNEDSLNLTIGEEDEKLLHDDSNIENDKKGEKGAADKADEKDGDDKTTDKSNANSETTGTAKDDKESAGNASSPSDKTGSGENKAKASPNAGDKGTPTVSRNLWVSGLSPLSRATDLKLIFSKYGKVIGAKVVTNTRTPGTRCYGYVTMASAKDATDCLIHLHRTELHGRMISIERAKSDLGPSKASGAAAGAKTDAAKTADSASAGEKDKEGKKEDGGKTTNDRDREREREHRERERDRDRERGRERERDHSRYYRSKSQARSRSQMRGRSMSRRSRSIDRDIRSRDDKSRDDTQRNDKDRDHPRGGERSRSRDREVLSLQKIREERERQRLREKERQLREEDRRRREMRARQREEEEMLRREREKLAMERARIEKEKAELLRIERERQKLEREKIELERLELKRQQRKIEEAKRNLKRPTTDHTHYDEDRKRSVGTDRRIEAPPPPSISSVVRGVPYKPAENKRLDDYHLSKRDDYKSVRPADDYRRDSFKRSNGGVDDYNKRDLDRPIQSIDGGRYQDNRSTGGNDYRSNNGGTRDDRNGGGAIKSRYNMDPIDNRYQDRSSGGVGGSAPWHSNSGLSSMNINPSMGGGNDNWRMDNNQDRYDRSYNERKAPQMNNGSFGMDTSRQNQFISGSSGGRPQDRYGAPVSSRFDNGRY